MGSIKITKFGGLLPRNYPTELKTQMAVEAIDVDLSRGTLRPFRTDKKVSGKTGSFLWSHKCCYITSDNCKASVSLADGDCNLVVASGLYPFPTQALIDDACAGNWTRIDFPEMTRPVATPEPQPEVIKRHEGDFNLEVNQYFYTLVRYVGGSEYQESYPSPISAPVRNHHDKKVTISKILGNADPMYGISEVNIYMATTQVARDGKFNDGRFLLIGTVPFGYTEFIHDPDVRYGEECMTVEWEPPPQNMQDLQYCPNGQFAGIVGDELWMSEPRKAHAFPEMFRYGRFNGCPIRFLATEDVGYIITDSRPAVIPIADPPEDGCRNVKIHEEPHPIVSYNSACTYNGAAFWATKDGMVMMRGNESRVITAPIISHEEWLQIRPWTIKAVVHDGFLYAFAEETAIRLKVPDNIHEQVEDMMMTNLSLRPLAVCRSDQDEFYFTDKDGTYQFAAGGDWKQFKWTSKVHSSRGYTAWTAYKIISEYEPVKVIHRFIKRHRKEVVPRKVIVGNHTVIGAHPRRLKSGYSTIEMEVEITGKGEIYEYHLATSINEIGER